MKVSEVLKTGLTGAATVGLVQEALHALNEKTNGDSPSGTHIMKEIKQGVKKGGLKSVKIYLKVATELLGMAGVLGLPALGKKKNAVLRGALLAGIVGAAVAFLKDKKDLDRKELLKQRAFTIGLYILGGMVAGKTFQLMNGKKSKKKK